MKVKRVRHICIVVKDINKMTKFYKEILGFEIYSNQVYRSEELGSGVGLKHAEFETTLLYLGNDLEIELTQYRSHNEILRDNNVYDNGYRHIAFIVEDIEESYREAISLGLECLSKPTYIKRLDGKELSFFYYKDPEGNILENNEFFQEI